MSQDNLVGRTVAGYKLLSHVGEGGTATVYRAEHPERGPAAIKILRPRMAQDPVAVKRFLREAEFGARIHHQYIIGTYDYGEAEGLYYLALEWAQGEPLASFLTASGRLAPPLAAQDHRAARRRPRRGPQGRDHSSRSQARQHHVRPVGRRPRGCSTSGSRGTPRTTRRTGSPGQGFFVGTLQYVAPEALSGELVGEQADVYSLATIAYHLLTGVLPFPGKSPRELFQQLLTQSPVPLNEAVKGLKFSPEIEAAVMTGLQRDLTKRWKTVGEFAKAFCAAAGAEAPPEKKGGFLSSFFKRGSE